MASQNEINVQWSKMTRWAMRIVGIPQRHFDVLEDSAAGSEVVFQAFALVVSSVAFAVTTGTYSYLLMDNQLWQSGLAGLVAGVMLFMIDRATMAEIRYEPSVGLGKAWVVRIATVFMAVMMAIVASVQTHKDDINRILSAKAAEADQQLKKSEDTAAKIKDSEDALSQARSDAVRRATLLKELTQAETDVANAQSELQRELEGAQDPVTGVQRIAKRGPKAAHFDAMSQAARDRVKALKSELVALGDVNTRIKGAEASLKKINEETEKIANVDQQGASKKVEALFMLLRDEWSCWPTFSYGIVLALLPEMVILRALGQQPAQKAVYESLKSVEQRRTGAMVAQTAHAMKDEIADRARRMKAAQRAAAVAAAGAPSAPTQSSAGRSSAPQFRLGNAHA